MRIHYRVPEHELCRLLTTRYPPWYTGSGINFKRVMSQLRPAIGVEVFSDLMDWCDLDTMPWQESH